MRHSVPSRCDTYGMVDAEPFLNPAQQRVLDVLGAVPAARPTFPVDIALRLRKEIDEWLAPIIGNPTEPYRVSKHTLSTVHGCEEHFLAERAAPFEITVRTAVGTVAHKAIELSQHWPADVNSADLVDAALTRVSESEIWLTAWLKDCNDGERAELSALANERVSKFLESFPPLRRRWRPVTENRLRADFAGGNLIVEGKVDLVIGRTRGNVAGKVFVDFKTGGSASVHTDDLRLYALLETLRLGVPPRVLASYYLDQGRLLAEEVSPVVLEAAGRRLIHGVEKVVDLLGAKRPPTRRPGPTCRWCPLAATCEDGQRHLAGEADEADDFTSDESEQDADGWDPLDVEADV